MTVDRGTMHGFPWVAIGSGPPVVLLAGLAPVTGFRTPGSARAALAPLRQVADRRRVFALNRRSGLPADLTMSGFAAEHAAAFRAFFDAPVDLVGVSTGGSIAAQVAADHPDVVRRLVLISSACRLGPVGRKSQADVAGALRAGRPRAAGAIVARALIPAAGWLAGCGGWLVGARAFGAEADRADLVATIEAEDGFDLARCRSPISAPTLIVGGQRDRFYPPDLFAETAALIPGSSLVTAPRRGHLGVTRDRRALARITGFLTWEPTDAR